MNRPPVLSLMRPEDVDPVAARVTLSPTRYDFVKAEDSLKQLAGAFTAVAGTVGVAHLFSSSSESWREDGEIRVKLHTGGDSWEEISIPTVLAFDETSGKLSSVSLGSSLELSLPFIAKAATVRGLEISSQVDCLRLLTGGIVHHVRLADVTELAVWKFLSEKFPIKDYALAVTVECRVARRDKIPEKIPIVVLDLLEIFGENSVCHRLVKLQLPFSADGVLAADAVPWAGSFSPSDPFWVKHPQIKEKLKFARNSWCMPLADFIRIFTDLYVAQIFTKNSTCTSLHLQHQQISDLPAISDSTPIPPHLPAKALLSGKHRSTGFAGDPKFPTHTQVVLRVKNASAPVHVTVDFSGEISAPVLLRVYKARGRRVWKHADSDVVASVETQRPHERMLALTLSGNLDSRKFILVLSSATLSAAHFRVFADAEAQVQLSPVPAMSEATVSGFQFPINAGGSLSQNALQWSMNPEICLDYRRDDLTSLMVVVKSQEEISGITIGKTDCQIPSLPKTALNTHAMLTSAKKRVLEKILKPTHPEFSAKNLVLPVSGRVFAEESTKCVLLENLTKEDFPLVVVPWRASDAASARECEISVFTDFPLDHCELVQASQSFRCLDAWHPSARRNIGNHSTWSSIPGKISTDHVCAYQLVSRKDLTLRISIVRDATGDSENLVDCMLAFYLLRDGVVAKAANFTPGPVLVEDVVLKAEQPLVLVPVTYKPNKRGSFLFEADAVGNFVRGEDWQCQQLL